METLLPVYTFSPLFRPCFIAGIIAIIRIQMSRLNQKKLKKLAKKVWGNIKTVLLTIRRKLKLIIALILLFAVVLFLIVELFSVLLIKKLGWNYEPAYLRIIKGYTSSNLVGGRTEYHSWGSWNVSNYSGRIANNCFDIKYNFNSYGARDKERSKEGQNRTIVLGDSFTEGWGVPQDKILAADLEKLSGKEYLNFGVSGSGTGPLNEYVLYRDFASEFEHDAVLVGFYPGNDFKDNDPVAWGGSTTVYYRPFWKLTEDKQDIEIVYFAKQEEGKFLPGLEPENRTPHFKIYQGAREFSAFLNLLVVLQNYKISLSKQSATQFAYNLEVSEDAKQATLIAYDKFAQLIGDKKKYIFVIPAASDVFYYLKTGKAKVPQFEEFKDSLTSQGWQVIDTIDAFANLPEDKIPEYFICDGHWNYKGDQLVADYLHKIIDQ
ncbi:hypothetical protein A3D25_04755 [Candidatus Daviesbacteria bacterium RIFCSPHIGHO2_02_FULL_43_12]|uniref:AlgX/AlgJ SGNH hydrolase-like domain-containing protein n=1 Tax=Candidatus Daviesbacteria bacterium RIFCSPHIGHO2_02_FULL_43_12 TaxID=1797776 RepID=A0A1F5KGX4_9BACT|nr:MAG: hypothetical protein A3D25_04755 [Candidatus Daviesbacteria bacterium RIFCSPHIGHO2_02_FULL_43_12]OGE70236.1 MAG: hypothetical protein A3B55_00815 [Candidatus Daviesbacteria bacterium RIFCSPLOWO2_01_FULL_43_15]